jgi:hypothetical protein
MNNFLAGVKSVAYSMNVSIQAMIRQQIVWGIVMGFALSTMIHVIIASENPRHVPHMLAHNKQAAFQKLAQKNAEGGYTTSYLQFQREFNRVRIVFYTALAAFLIVVLIGLLQY